ncbi:MAG: gamma-glutamylcyclotransferase [Pseudomonadota bacterium]
MVLTRESLRTGFLQQLVASGGDTIKVLSEAELRETRQAALTEHQEGENIWLFAYGSLIWNPAFHFVSKAQARISGYHRRFCLWTHLGRGSKERPGLILGLDRGGSCRGLAYEIAHNAIESELDIVWRREMVSAAYRPTWVRMQTEHGPRRALTFVINRNHERYCRQLDDQKIAAAIAQAQGPLGTCAEYLFNTTDHLAELGIADPSLTRLCTEVRTQLKAPKPVNAEA